MKQMVGLLLGLALLFFAGTGAAGAETTADILQDTLEQVEKIQVQGFDFAGVARQAAAGELDFTPEGILAGLGDMLFSGLKENIGLLIKMIVLSVLAGVLCNLQQNLPGESVAEISFLSCLAMIAGLSATVVSEMMELALSTIDALMLFMQSLMPVMGSLAITGNAAGLAGFYPALFLSMQSFTFLCKNFFLPLIMTITALSVVNAMSSRFHITRLIDFTRQAVKWGIGLLLTIYVGILSLRGFGVAATAGVAGRTVKYALCNFIPLVGGVLAESAEAVIASLRTIRGAVGIAGVLAAISLCGVPLVKMLVVSVLYRFAAGVAEPATDQRIVRLLMDLSGNITLILTIVLMVSVMFIISVAMLCILL